MYKNILIPTDGSEFAQKAVGHGVGLAKALGARITAFFSAPPATPIIYRNSLPVGYTTTEEHQALIEQTTKRNLGFIEQAAKQAGVPCEAVHAINDFPDDEIIKTAARHNCDLIVMASHGQSGLRGVLIGSVAQKVLSRSSVPVLIIR